MAFVRSLLRSWLPVGVAFVLGGLFMGTASGHGGFPDFLHAGHSDTMNGTLTAAGFRFKQAKTVRLVVPGSAFVPNREGPGATPNDSVHHSGYSGQAFVQGGDIAVAPVNLPHGAVVKSLTLFHDGSDPAGSTLDLEASDSSRGFMTMARAPSNGSCPSNPCSSTDGSIALAVINNLTKHYGLTLTTSTTSSIHLYKAVIRYQVKTPGPASG